MHVLHWIIKFGCVENFFFYIRIKYYRKLFLSGTFNYESEIFGSIRAFIQTERKEKIFKYIIQSTNAARGQQTFQYLIQSIFPDWITHLTKHSNVQPVESNKTAVDRT